MSTPNLPDPTIPTHPTYVTVAEAARYLKIARGTADNWRSAGIGPAYCKLNGHRVVYDLAELERYVAAGTVSTTTAAAA